MIGYDFDDTIYRGNSYRSFYWHCLLRSPQILLFLPLQAIVAILYVLHILDKNQFMRVFCMFIVLVPHKDRKVKSFWDKNMRKIKKWYLDQHKADDLIISASPRYLVEEACNRLGIKNCIATEMNLSTGRIVGDHCYGNAKVEMYKQVYGDTPLEAYYSDSFTDMPILLFAKKGYLVEGEKVMLYCQDGKRLVNLNKRNENKNVRDDRF